MLRWSDRLPSILHLHPFGGTVSLLRSTTFDESVRRLFLPGALLALVVSTGFLLATSSAPVPAEAAAARVTAADPGEHDFGDAVIVFNLEYQDDLVPAVPWAFEHARVRRLGNVYFLTGTEPGQSGRDVTRHWVPLADVVRMTEFDSVEAARRAVDEESDVGEDERPVLHRASVRSSRRAE